MIALVVTAYGLPQHLIDRFFDYNNHENIIIVTDKRAPRSAERIICPQQEVFSITKTANLGIRHAYELGYDVIIKTDIDNIVTAPVIDYCNSLKPGTGACFRNWHISDNEPLSDAQMDSKCIGTAALHSDDWNKLHGYNEKMYGYGYDDGDLLTRARRRGIDFPELEDPKVYHFWHEKHNRDTINPINRLYNIENRKHYSNRDWGISL